MAWEKERIFGAPEPISPYLRRWILFVDGENVTMRGQQLAKERGIALSEGPSYHRDVFLWLPLRAHATRVLTHYLRDIGVQEAAARAFYYTSMSGDLDAVLRTQEALWELGFTPEVFKKDKKKATAKGVDIALTKDLLSNAFLNNYEVAVRVSGTCFPKCFP